MFPHSSLCDYPRPVGSPYCGGFVFKGFGRLMTFGPRQGLKFDKVEYWQCHPVPLLETGIPHVWNGNALAKGGNCSMNDSLVRKQTNQL